MVRPTTSNRSSQANAHQHRLNATIVEVARRRRARTTTPNVSNKNCKYVLEQAKRRAHAKFARKSTFPLKAAALGMGRDQEMHPSASCPPDMHLPLKLSRPEYSEVTPEALLAAQLDPNLPIQHVIDGLEVFGPDMLRSLATVKANPTKDAIPDKLNITMQDPTFPPTHMVAVHGRHIPNVPLKVTIYPVHSLVFAAHCARLPPFPPSTAPAHGATKHTLPVLRMPLPSPENYFRLSAYIYSKNAKMLFTSLMPQRPSDALVDSIGKAKARKQDVIEFAHKLAETYTSRALFSVAMNIQGLWRNVCALGIFDDGIWEVMDLAWWIILSALAISTGAPLDLIEDNCEE